MDNANRKGKESNAEPLKLLPPLPGKIDPGISTPAAEMPPVAPDKATQSSTLDDMLTGKAPLADARGPQPLNDEALKLLDQYSRSAKADSFTLIQALSNSVVLEDELLEGSVQIVDRKNVNDRQGQAIGPLAKALSDDVDNMQKIIGNSAPPTSRDLTKRDSFLADLKIIKDQTGAAAMNSGDVIADVEKLGTAGGSTQRLAEDAQSAFQAISEARKALADILPSSTKDLNQYRAHVTDQDIINQFYTNPLSTAPFTKQDMISPISNDPISQTRAAIQELYSAKQNLPQVPHIDKKKLIIGFGRLALSAAALASSNPLPLAMTVGRTLPGAFKPHGGNGKAGNGNDALIEIKASVKAFHTAEAQCTEFLKNESSQNDAVSTRQITHIQDDLTQAADKLHKLELVTGLDKPDNEIDAKNANWTEIDKSVNELVNDKYIKDLGRQTGVVLDQY